MDNKPIIGVMDISITASNRFINLSLAVMDI